MPMASKQFVSRHGMNKKLKYLKNQCLHKGLSYFSQNRQTFEFCSGIKNSKLGTNIT